MSNCPIALNYSSEKLQNDPELIKLFIHTYQPRYDIKFNFHVSENIFYQKTLELFNILNENEWLELNIPTNKIKSRTPKF